MRKLRSDKSFKKFLTEGGFGVKIAILIFTGILLMALGALGSASDGAEEAALEEQMAELCSSVSGVGECRVMITYGEEGEVYAVAVLCEGAESVTVRQSVKELVSSLFGIGTNRVSVLKISE